MGKKVERDSDKCSDGSTEYNLKAAKSSARRTGKIDSFSTNYSIPGKKRNSYKQDGD